MLSFFNRYHFFVLVSLGILYFNGGQAQNIDSLAVTCIKTNYFEKGVDIDSILNVYEEYLIEKRYFSNSDEEKYSFYFKKMVKENDFIGAVPEHIFEAISKVEMGRHLDKACFNYMDGFEIDISVILTANKMIQLGEQLNILEDSNLAPNIVGKFFLENFSEKEMQSSYLRMTILILIGWVTDLNKMTDYMEPLLPPIKG